MALAWLKAILGEAFTEDIEGKVETEIGKHFVARGDFNATNEAKKGLETQLADANKAIEEMKGKAPDSEAVQAAVKEWQEKHETDTKALKEQLSKSEYTHKVEVLSLREKFTSEAARKAFVADLVKKGLPMEDEKLVGYDDFKKSYMESDPGAFAKADDTTPATVKTGGSHTEQPPTGDPQTLAGALEEYYKQS